MNNNPKKTHNARIAVTVVLAIQPISVSSFSFMLCLHAFMLILVQPLFCILLRRCFAAWPKLVLNVLVFDTFAFNQTMRALSFFMCPFGSIGHIRRSHATLRCRTVMFSQNTPHLAMLVQTNLDLGCPVFVCLGQSERWNGIVLLLVLRVVLGFCDVMFCACRPCSATLCFACGEISSDAARTWEFSNAIFKAF